MTHCRKEVRSTCFFKESMPFDPFVKSLPPLPTRSLSSRERQYVRQLCISSWLHHAHPFLAAAEKGRKSLSYARIVDVQLFAIVGWKWGCQPFSCRCSQNVTHCRKEVRSTCFLRNPFPPFLLGIPSIHSLPEAGSWERHYAPPGLHYGCTIPIPSLQLHEKP